MIYTPKNTRFNREAGIMEKSVQVIERKNGVVYFIVLEDDNNHVFCTCEEAVFDKEFSADNPTETTQLIETPLPASIKPAFRKYPMDLKKSKR